MYDSNSQIPSGYHNGRTIFYVFGRYPAIPYGDNYPVLDLVICHGDFLSADHEYAHQNKSVRVSEKQFSIESLKRRDVVWERYFMKILLTGFEPFAGSQVNPSGLAVQRISSAPPVEVDLKTLVLPVVYYRAAHLVREALDIEQPDIWLGIGQGGVAGVSVESVGLNLNHARIPDNAGNIPWNQVAVPGGPAAYFTTIPSRELVEYLLSEGIPARVSLSAGTFICNHVLFAALQHTAASGLRTSCGFIHVPLLPEQAAAEPGELRPSMSLEYLESALRTAIGWLANYMPSDHQGTGADALKGWGLEHSLRQAKDSFTPTGQALREAAVEFLRQDPEEGANILTGLPPQRGPRRKIRR